MRVTSTIHCHADPAVFGVVRRFVAHFVLLAGGSGDDADEMELAAGEVLANAYRHAYGQTHGPLQLEMSHDEQKVEVTIRDEGVADASSVIIPSVPAGGTERRGLFLVGKLTDHVEMSHPRDGRGGTIVRMVKHVNNLHRLFSIVGLR